MGGESAADPLSPPPSFPYLDLLLERLEAGDPGFSAAFGRHVHWGFWADPALADGSIADYAAAAERLSDQLLRLAAITAGERVLDAGCGIGGTLAQLDRRACGLDLTGLNIDGRQLRRAAASVAPSPGNLLRWVEGDACAMPFATHAFDAVLAVECIFHFPSREAFFAECARVLVPGGRLVLCDFVPTAALRLLQRLGPGPGARVRATYGPIDGSCSLGGYRHLARRHGMRLQSDLDITASTLPTYGVVERLFRQAGWPAGAESTAAIGWLSRTGLLRYRILAFHNGGGSADS